MPDTSQTAPDTNWTAALRGLARRCPNCGKGKLFRAYLKQVDGCAACGEPYGHIRADDGPAWLTMLVMGHVVVAMLLAVEPNVDWPQWVSIPLWCLLAVLTCVLFLPSAKGLFIAMIWRNKGPGSERDA